MTAPDSELAQLATAGELLATVDGVAYRTVQLVFAQAEAGAPALYCRYADWPSTPAARLAAKDREIAELEIILSRQAAESVKQAQRASAAEARIKELEARLAAVPPEPPSEPIVCPDCGKGDLKSAKALQMHRQRVHEGMQAGRPRPPIQLMEADQGWRCAEPGCSGAFTRDMHDPQHCTKHATRSPNGIEIAA